MLVETSQDREQRGPVEVSVIIDPALEPGVAQAASWCRVFVVHRQSRHDRISLRRRFGFLGADGWIEAIEGQVRGRSDRQTQ